MRRSLGIKRQVLISNILIFDGEREILKSNFYGEEKFLKKKVCLSGQLAHDWHVIPRHMVEHVEQLLCVMCFSLNVMRKEKCY